MRGGCFLMAQVAGLVLTAAPATTASAAIVGAGDKIVFCAEVPAELVRQLPEEMQDNVAIGFLYRRAHILWCDLYTANGRHVLYDRKSFARREKYWELSRQQWLDLLGEERYASLPVPFSYRYPSSWYIVPGLLLVGFMIVGWRRLFPSESLRARRLYFSDASYRQALRMVKLPADRSASSEDVRRQAVDLLMEKGMSEQDARQQLSLLERHIDPLRPGGLGAGRAARGL